MKAYVPGEGMILAAISFGCLDRLTVPRNRHIPALGNSLPWLRKEDSISTKDIYSI